MTTPPSDRGVRIRDGLAAELLRNLAAGATALHERDGTLPSAELVEAWRDLIDARARARGTSASGSVPAPAPRLDGRDEELTVAAVAELLGCSASWVRQLARSGRLPATRAGRDWTFAPTAVDTYRFHG